MILSVIIPVYNEENHIEQVVDEVREFPLDFNKEIIIVDDASTDKTRRLLNRYKKSRNIKIVLLEQNRGKGFAIREGLKKASGEIILIQDADREYSVKDYPALIRPLLQHKAKIVYGSRFKGRMSGMRWPNWLANKILTLSANLLYGLNLTDEATAYKVFKAEVVKSINLKCERFEFCPEITAKAAKKGYQITEVPITYKARIAKDGKKIKFTDGFAAFWTLLKYRFID